MKSTDKEKIPNSAVNNKQTLGEEKSTSTPKPISNDIIAENFVLLNQIGKGAFGEIFLSFNLRDNIEVAIKKEIKRPNKPSQLKMEAKVYQSLLSIEQGQDISGNLALGQKVEQGVPVFYGFGELPDLSGFYLVIEFLGPNLNELLKFCNMKKFTISTVCLLGIQILNRIENMHKHNFLHRDIKPENFMIGSQDNSNIIYLIDFGLSKRYKNTRTNQHIPYREGRNLVGTARYVSINTHLGIEQSRRDDLESIAYMVIFFLKGYLPWQGLKGGEKYQRIMEKKLQIPTDILCLGLPEEIAVYLNYVKGLRFEDRPDYDFLRSLFIKTLSMCVSVYGIEKENLKFDWNFDDPKTQIWELFKEGGKRNNYNDNSPLQLDLKGKEANDKNQLTPNPNTNANTNTNANSANLKMLEKNLNVNKEGNDDNAYKKRLSKIKETTEIDGSKNDDITFDKTNENNPNASSDDDGDSSDSSEGEDKRNVVKKREQKKKKKNVIKEENEEEKNSSREKAETFESKRMQEKNEQKKDVVNKFATGKFPKNNNTKENEEQKSNSLKSKEEKEEIRKGQFDITSIKKDKENAENSEDTLNEEFSPSNIDLIKKHDITSILVSATTEGGIEKYINKLLLNCTKREQSKNIESKNMESKNELSGNDFDASKSGNEKNQEQESKPMIIEIAGYKESTIINDLGKADYLKKLETELDDNKEEEKKTPNKVESNKQVQLNKYNNKNEKKDTRKLPLKPRGSLKEVRENEKMLIRSQSFIKEELPKSNQVKIKFSKEILIKIKKEPVTRYYQIKSDLGQGSYGTVKKVRHKKLYEERAMKIVTKKSEESQNEIDILRRISHPNIVNIFEIFEDPKKYYIIQELFDGGELFDFITNQGTFLETDAAIIMKQILTGVNYLHSLNIVHRDLKPENIMLISKPNSARKYALKIIDFGTAVQIRPGEKINKFVGTSYYIAPEVLAENYDEKCDVWSCGVIMYILLCGYPPFNGSSNVDIFHNIQYSQPIFNEEEWKDISPLAIELIKGMLNKNPHKRFTAEISLKHKWFKENENDDPFGLKTYTKKCNQLRAVNKMADFVKENKFKQAMLQFFTTQFDIKQEEENLKDVFSQFDVENTGQITKKVFLKELIKLYGEDDAKALTNKIFNTLDLDGNGDISYNEFLTSIIDNKKFITNERLEKAFKMFDKDGNGKLSIEEIKSVFGGDDKKWKEIIKEVDLNDDGEIDFEEFKVLMTGANSRDMLDIKPLHEKKMKFNG